MKRYQSHKIVEAAPIDHIEKRGDGDVAFVEVNCTLRDVRLPADFFGRGEPSPGDYLVRYQPDGYLSWSPRAAFEDGYTLVEDKPASWQGRAKVELDELTTRIDGLRKALLAGTVTDQHALALLQRQYRAMDEYAYTLMARLRYLGVIDTETPPVVRETPAAALDAGEAVRVTVSAPAGKRAEVIHGRGEEQAPFTVTAGQTQEWSVRPGERVAVRAADASTVAHKRPAE